MPKDTTTAIHWWEAQFAELEIQAQAATTVSQIYKNKLDAAERRAEALATAIKELLDEGVPMDMGCCFYCASLQPERRHNNGCNWAKLRELVMEQD